MTTFKLGEICSIIKGNVGIQKAVAGEYPLVVTAENRSSCDEYQFDCKAVCIPLVSSTGHGHASINRLHYQEGKFALGNILAAVIPNDDQQLSAEYLYLYLSFYKDEKIVALMKGAANVSLTINSIRNIEIDVPSIQIQLEIIKKINDIKLTNNTICKKLQEQTISAKQLRTTILQEALCGKLVKQGSNKETAIELFKKINQEKEQLEKDGKTNNEKMLPNIEKDTPPFLLPMNWTWVRLKDITTFITDFQANGSFASLKENVKTYNLQNYAIFVRLKDLRKHLKKIEDLVYTDESGYKYLRKSALFGGEILVANVGAGTGTTLLMPQINKPATIAPNMFIVYLSKFIDKKYFLLFCKSTTYFDQINKLAGGSAQPKINKSEYRSIFFPLPPLEEQKLIVAKIDELMELCDELEGKIEQSQAESDKLMRSILQESFSNDTSKGPVSVVKNMNPPKVVNIISAIEKRAVLSAEIICQLYNQKRFGAVKNEKILYLCERHLNLDIGGCYYKMTAGPHDYKSRYKVEEIFKEQKWISISKNDSDNQEKVSYIPAENFGRHKASFNINFIEKTEEIQSLIDLFKNKTTEKCEIVATLYAVWNDLLIDEQPISEELIVRNFKENWTASKERFYDSDLKDELLWMKIKGLVPKGTGNKTLEPSVH